MLTPSQQVEFTEFIVDIYGAMELELIENLAKQFKSNSGTSDMAKWQMKKLNEMGQFTKKNTEIISKYSGIAADTVNQVFSEAGYKALQGDISIYQMAFNEGLISTNPVNVHALPAIQQILNAAIKNTKQHLNMINTKLYQGLNREYNRIVSQAYLEVSTGLKDYGKATHDALAKLADKGIIKVPYKRNGTLVQYPADAAVRRNIFTSIGQMTGQMQLTLADEMGCNFVEVTSHFGARPDHAEWQGGVYQIHSSDKYPNLADATGYGTIEGLKGVNCRHDFFPFFPGLSARSSFPYDLKANEAEYKLTQKQRYLENEVRKAKRKCISSEAVGDTKKFEIDSAALKSKEQKLKEFIKGNNRTQRARVNTYGFGRSASQKAVWADKRKYRADLKSKGINITLKDVANHRNLKYTNPKEYALQQNYLWSVNRKMLSPLVGYDHYKTIYQQIERDLIGITASSGIKITGQSRHFIERIIGVREDPKTGKPRVGISIDDAKDALLRGDFKDTKSRNRFGELTDGVLHKSKKVKVSVNPHTGILIQCSRS